MLSISRLSLAAGLLFGALASSSALAAKIEKVDMAREGIDLKPIVVKANGNGYTGVETASHRYTVRVFAKGKGSNNIFWAAISNNGAAHPLKSGIPYFFSQRIPNGDDGWGVYKKSLSFDMKVSNTLWATSPKGACQAKLAAEMAKGKSKTQALQKEYKVMANAQLLFYAAADSKSNIKKRDHSLLTVERGGRAIYYPVQVVCRRGA